jgi:hypothetical protein
VRQVQHQRIYYVTICKLHCPDCLMQAVARVDATAVATHDLHVKLSRTCSCNLVQQTLHLVNA